MANVFRLDDKHVDKPNRNTFDLSFQNNLTLKYGKLIPVMCKEVLPGDSVKIDPTFALRYLPQVFPVQTRQRASIKCYYVRNRNLWKDWPDFIGKTKSGLVPPYLYFDDVANRALHPSSLADYMGIPIHIKPSQKEGVNNIYEVAQPNFVDGNDYAYIPNSNLAVNEGKGEPFALRTLKSVATELAIPSVDPYADSNYELSMIYGGVTANGAVPLSTFRRNQSVLGGTLRPSVYSSPNLYLNLFRQPIVPHGSFQLFYGRPVPTDEQYFCIVRTTSGTDVLMNFQNEQSIDTTNTYNYYRWNGKENALEQSSFNVESVIGFITYVPNDSERLNPQIEMVADARVNDLCWCDVAYKHIPFANQENPDGIRISALPFRGVESIYNALVRNAENNPLIIDGQPEYNKYIRHDEGGPQSVFNLLNDYHPNWADDRFTTALPSPQQGDAPLVGLTGNQGATLTISSEDGTTSTLHLQVDADTGNVIMVDGFSSNTPDNVRDEIMSAVDFGIAINDLRNVNAYQRWKENNIRRGYKYKDQMSSHYGVTVRFDVLDMPEFIGGVTRDVNVSQVTQTVENEYGNLGDYGGQSGIFGEGHSMEHYCDEHGFIIALICVYPMPLYTDILPKHLIKQDCLDYMFPEFGKIGPQAITKKELAFSQSIAEGKQNETFGYQRAWYDYLESLDEVHGLYHSDFRNFLMAREFYQTPTLGRDFLTIDSEDINNTFYVDDDKDKILGQVYFKLTMKRPIPLLGIPSIE